MSLRLVPVSLDIANAFVAQHHRHHRPTPGHRFSIGAWDGHLRGVAIIGRPVARALDQRRLVEVNRNCTDGTRYACSLLYGAAARAAQALGYFAILTYTLEEEGGASLRASGWWGEPALDLVKMWDGPSRSREGGIAKPKWRWVRFLSEWPEDLPELPMADDGQGALFSPPT